MGAHKGTEGLRSAGAAGLDWEHEDQVLLVAESQDSPTPLSGCLGGAGRLEQCSEPSMLSLSFSKV